MNFDLFVTVFNVESRSLKPVRLYIVYGFVCICNTVMENYGLVATCSDRKISRFWLDNLFGFYLSIKIVNKTFIFQNHNYSNESICKI